MHPPIILNRSFLVSQLKIKLQQARNDSRQIVGAQIIWKQFYTQKLGNLTLIVRSTDPDTILSLSNRRHVTALSCALCKVIAQTSIRSSQHLNKRFYN